MKDDCSKSLPKSTKRVNSSPLIEFCQLVSKIFVDVDSIYDPNPGSLILSSNANSGHAQEINAKIRQLLRQNIFDIGLVEGDTLTNPGLLGQTFEAVVNHPPLPIDNDGRFGFGLAPKSKTD